MHKKDVNDVIHQGDELSEGGHLRKNLGAEDILGFRIVSGTGIFASTGFTPSDWRRRRMRGRP